MALKQVSSVQETFCGKIPARVLICVMLYLSSICSYMIRSTMSMTIIAMANPSENSSNIKVEDYGPRYNWSAYDQGLILGAFFWGYSLSMIPSGFLAEWYGGKIVLGLSFGSCAILTLITPLAANTQFWILFLVRLLIGLFSGSVYPVIHNLISHWAPPEEKGKFTGALLASSMGTLITWPTSGLIINSFGWVYVFYISGGVATLFTLLWFLIIYNTPKQHPWISLEEKIFIESRIKTVTAKSKIWPPYLRIIRSLPFLVLVPLHYGTVWGICFTLTDSPKYIHEVLGFDLSSTGFLAILPQLMMFIFSLLSGIGGDTILKRKWLKPNGIRKLFCILSHIMPGLFLFAINYVPDYPYLCVAFISLSLGFCGISTITNLQNPQDLAPNFAGTIYGLINCIGTTSGFISPLVVAHYTKNQSTADEWYIIFVIAGLLYVVPAIFYMLFGSAEVQAWNEPNRKKITINSATDF